MTRLTLASLAVGLTLASTLAFAQTSPSLTTTELAERAVERRAVEAAIWGIPLVSVDAMREAFFRDAGAKYNDILYWTSPSTWKNQFTTPNSSNYYVYFNYNLRDGPVVLELPAAVGAGLFGTILDAWQVPLADIGPEGEDKGQGGKYLLLPPDYDSAVPEGHIVLRSQTYNGYALFRAIPKTRSDEDVARALALVKQQRLYRQADAGNPPEQKFIDVADTLLDGIVSFDESFYVRLARMVDEEPVQPRDLAMMGQLRTLGIEKGKKYTPEPSIQPSLKRAAEEAHAILVSDSATKTTPWWPGLHWTLSDSLDLATKTGFSFVVPEFLDIDGRGAIYYLAFAPPAKLGAASFYLVSYFDSVGDQLDGGKNYRLHIPRDVPAEQFWAVTVYDLNTAGFIREAPVINRDSYDQQMVRNADGSVDLYFGPTPPTGKKDNWIYTAAAGKPWFAMFRFYGPTKPLFEKAWKPGDIEKAN